MSGITYDAERLREIGERYGVARLEVFGSVSRGEGRSDSDIDLLYELKPEARLGFAFFELEDELADLFGRPVDLVARDAVSEHIRSQILHDARPLYAA
ncbi:nucleotidyltransferase [Microbacterium protaetiae]|uniref:Nucleotidyltransferase n=1 Tax=Microbacterium protaetiae TaxID=2509458 RepID=A0A4P6EDT6_9MICO|nr:nucleotidyltransferase family protein [Microbacterium protaetiae]QAY59239.1 nucleotidyltransferase [Microbacterium protaetiae]